MSRATTLVRQSPRSESSPAVTVRCAIYTRKSTEEGLEQEFNSLDAQREAAEAYVKSQASEGWALVPGQYDDGGFTGGNMDRPAFKRLMEDIQAGRIDCVVVYKVDRLSRSLLDFTRIIETFDAHQISFVSVTQQFNTASSMGRLMLNVLLSFAQFEREIISERTRDKIAASRRKGKWSGGMPVLGYDVDSQTKKLVVNELEATRVQKIFELYLKSQSIMAVIRELDERQWSCKRWVKRDGMERGGKPFNKSSLHTLLTNVVYAGKIRYKDEIHNGEQQAIVTADIWQRTQSLLQRNGRTGGTAVRNKFGALLKGILRCVPCNCAMSPSHSTRKGNRRYRYYVCSQAQKRGWDSCPSKSIPAAEIEKFVVDQIRRIGANPELVHETIDKVHQQIDAQLRDLGIEGKSIQRDLAHWNAEIRNVVPRVGVGGHDSPVVARLAELQERAAGAERRLREIEELRRSLKQRVVRQSDVRNALADFDLIWESLTTREQIRVVELLVARVDYDGAEGKVAVTFHEDGINKFAGEFGTGEQA